MIRLGDVRLMTSGRIPLIPGVFWGNNTDAWPTSVLGEAASLAVLQIANPVVVGSSFVL